jgi:ribosomal protein L29
MWWFKKKTQEQTAQEQLNKTLSELDGELGKLKQQQAVATAEKQKQEVANTDEDKEKLYLKALSDVEAIVRYCEMNRLTTPKQWKENNIPVKEVVTEFLKHAKGYTDFKVGELRKELNQIKGERKLT